MQTSTVISSSPGAPGTSGANIQYYVDVYVHLIAHFVILDKIVIMIHLFVVVYVVMNVMVLNHIVVVVKIVVVME